jgi:uncharacterized repeat protein (TIGR03803 family)
VKARIKNLLLLRAIIVALGLIFADQATAQIFTALHSFTAPSGLYPFTNSDGANPYAGLILSSNILYGTTQSGGSSGRGTVFAINTDSTGFTNLYSFSPLSDLSAGTNSDGANPQARLVLSGNTLYGTAFAGGSSDKGTVFALNTDGTGFTNLHNFIGADGAYPNGLILSGTTLYGTTQEGPTNGSVFAVNTDGTGFSTLHTFSQFSGPDDTNSGGAFPYAGLLLSSNVLYGTTSGGGIFGKGTVFSVTTDGLIFSTLHHFAGHPNDGSAPQPGLIISDGTLYGTTVGGGSNLYGTVFAMNSDGSDFTNLYSFSGTNGGAAPCDGLILSDNTLYGTTSGAGTTHEGTVFAISANGADFMDLYNFRPLSNQTNSDGASPYAGLVLSGATVYGTAVNGGISGYGTVFSISFEPQLTIITAGTNVVLTWPANVAGLDYSGFKLQSTTNLLASTWNTASPAPVVVSGQNTVTNSISGTQLFFRLSQ